MAIALQSLTGLVCDGLELRKTRKLRDVTQLLPFEAIECK